MNQFSDVNKFEKLIIDIADYVFNDELQNQDSLKSASFCLMDSLGCGLEALEYEACKKMLCNQIMESFDFKLTTV